MIWADRDKNLIVVFLTNRVHPSALNTLISEARAAIVDEIVKAYQK
jgi:CubicO group peptidase (beta-lactamase class C family)